jgi:hypothetical protein
MQCSKYFEALGAELRRHQGIASGVSSGPGKAHDKTDPDRVADGS